MRLDKFLKVAGLAKRRGEAKAALAAGRIACGGRPVKPSHEVKVGDELVLHYVHRTLRVRVEAVPAGRSAKHTATQLYSILGDSPH